MKRRKEIEQQSSLQGNQLLQTPATLTSSLWRSGTVDCESQWTPSSWSCFCETSLSLQQEKKLREHLSEHRWYGPMSSHHLYRAYIGFPSNLQMASWVMCSARNSETYIFGILHISEYGTSCIRLLRQKHFMFLLSCDYPNLPALCTVHPLTVPLNLSHLKSEHVFPTFYDHFSTGSCNSDTIFKHTSLKHGLSMSVVY